MSNISATVKSIQDIMRQDAGIDGDAQRIGQLTWLLFLKIFDDREYETELLDAGYRSPIPETLRWRTWATPREGITGDDLLDFVNNQLFPNLKQFAESATSGRASVIGNVFQDAFNYMKNGTLIRQVLNKINEIDFNRSEDRHLFGDIYEQILKDLQSAGNSGEYYTPRAVTQFMVDIVNPKLGEKVLDPFIMRNFGVSRDTVDCERSGLRHAVRPSAAAWSTSHRRRPTPSQPRIVFGRPAIPSSAPPNPRGLGRLRGSAVAANAPQCIGRRPRTRELPLSTRPEVRLP